MVVAVMTLLTPAVAVLELSMTVLDVMTLLVLVLVVLR
jgi:hypothetical protein